VITTRTYVTTVLAVATLLVTLGSSSTGTAPGKPDIPLPESIKRAGKLKFAADFTSPPLQYYDANHNMIGINVDLCGSIAEHLGVKAEWVNLTFHSLIPALNAGRFDAICTEMFITAERAKAVAFVPYMQTGQSIVVSKGNPRNVRRLEDICGLRAGLQLGTVEEVTVKQQTKACEAKKKPAVDIKTFNYAADAVLQVLNGRADFWMADDPEAAYYAKTTPNKVDIAVAGINPTLDGIGVSPSNYLLAGAITAAFYAMKLDGSYHTIMLKWNIFADEIGFF
jgi:polar amino acid transport system substrate-binding protein